MDGRESEVARRSGDGLVVDPKMVVGLPVARPARDPKSKMQRVGELLEV